MTQQPAMADGSQPLVALVDDDDDLRAALRDYLQPFGYQVVEASDGRELDALLPLDDPDIIILDVMMPGEDGLAICRRLSATGRLVLLLSALGTTTDRIVGLETGAADYLAKPFEPRELLARIRAVLRRPAMEREQRLDAVRIGDWTLLTDQNLLVHSDARRIPLTSGESRLMESLAGRAGRILTRDALLTAARGIDADGFDRSIDLMISRLRRKLARHQIAGMIETVRGEGYRMVFQDRS